MFSALRKRERHPEIAGWLAGQRPSDLYLSVVSIGEIERGLSGVNGRDAGFALREVVRTAKASGSTWSQRYSALTAMAMFADERGNGIRPISPLQRPGPGAILHAMKTPEAETRRALARLRRAVEKARREVRGLRDALDPAESDGFPGDDYAAMDEHLAAVTELVNREQSRQQAKILRGGGMAPGRLRRSGEPLLRGRVGGDEGRRP